MKVRFYTGEPNDPLPVCIHRAGKIEKLPVQDAYIKGTRLDKVEINVTGMTKETKQNLMKIFVPCLV